MPASTKETRAELIFLATVFAVGALVAFEGWRLPASRFEPLGAGAFPLGIGALLMTLAAIGLAMKWYGRDIGRAETALVLGVGDSEATHRRRPWLTVFAFAALAAYCLVLQFTEIGFFYATIPLLVALGLAMVSARDMKTIAIYGAIGVGASAALTFVFGTLLRLVLP